MRTQLSAEATEFGDVLDTAISAAGGMQLARDAEREGRTDVRVADLFDQLGVWSLDVSAGVELEAAAIACRAAGRYALPYPVAERLAAKAIGHDGALAVTDGRASAVMAAAELDWLICDLAGRVAPLSVGSPQGGRLGTFLALAEPGEWHEGGDAALVLALHSWVLLGMVERAAELTYDYAKERVQFGKPISTFQGPRFRIADMAASVQGLEELAKYTLWSLSEARAGRLVDALALRLSCLESAEAVFRSAHQLYGAMGFCDESDVSWLSRASQPLRRLPFGRAQTEDALLDSIERLGFDGLFDWRTEDPLLDAAGGHRPPSTRG